MGIPSVADIMPKRKKGGRVIKRQRRNDSISVLDRLLKPYYASMCAKHSLLGNEGWPVEVSKMAGEDLDYIAAWGWFLTQFEKDGFATSEYVQKQLHFIRSGLGNWRRANSARRAALTRLAALREAEPEPEEVEKPDAFYASQRWRRLRYEFLKDCAGTCEACGRSRKGHGVILHVDHIKPRSKFPHLSLERSNLQALCEDCNLGKSNRDTIDWRTLPESGNSDAEAA